jgi:cytochrome o ubiquinol oxidase operon protein cyoD
MSDHHELIDAQPVVAQKMLKGYWLGLILSIICTVAAFILLEKRLLNDTQLYTGLALLAIIQIWAQIAYFLQVNTRTQENRWHFISLIFTILIMLIIISGSLWIMYNLNYYMVH